MSYTPFARWRNFTLENLKSMLDLYPDLLDKTSRNTVTDAIEETFLHHSAVLDAITVPHLIHGDLWYGNILVDRERNLAAMIDGDRALFGDPEFELATGWMISDSFLEGYGRGLDMSEEAVKTAYEGMKG